MTTSLQALLAFARREMDPLDARLLLQHATGLSHGEVIADPQRVIGESEIKLFNFLVARRMRGEPVSRIIGAREFYGREFLVTPAVLDPRPDTETLIDEALMLMGQAPRILDLGAGSGAIIITLLAERADALAVAVDISEDALAVASANASVLGVASRLSFIQGDWFSAVVGRFDLIISNPPYIVAATIATLEPEVREFDPRLALDGGADGLGAYRQIAAGAMAHLATGGHVIVEIGAGQENDVAAIFASAGFVLVSTRRDLGGHIRCLSFCGQSQN